jgi:hypothetical protein
MNPPEPQARRTSRQATRQRGDHSKTEPAPAAILPSTGVAASRVEDVLFQAVAHLSARALVGRRRPRVSRRCRPPTAAPAVVRQEKFGRLERDEPAKRQSLPLHGREATSEIKRSKGLGAARYGLDLAAGFEEIAPRKGGPHGPRPPHRLA